MLVCGGLLVLKATGLVHDAYAQAGSQRRRRCHGAAAAPANKDFAGGDGDRSPAPPKSMC